ncbi:unnamed protein product, partial [Candidula unifasciata]
QCSPTNEDEIVPRPVEVKVDTSDVSPRPPMVEMVPVETVPDEDNDDDENDETAEDVIAGNVEKLNCDSATSKHDEQLPSKEERSLRLHTPKKVIPRLTRGAQREEFASLPKMNQVQFIQLWRTLYDIFTDLPEEQYLYRSLATVGTLLLQLGEIGKRLPDTKLNRPEKTVPETVDTKADPSASSTDDWSITFEQLLASILTEPPLVDFFERIYDTTDAVAALRSQRLATKVPASTSKQ